MSRATIKDVARHAGVSVKTVSRVINKEPSVRESTITKVQQSIQELDYHPDSSARNLRGNRSYAIGLVYDNPNAYYIVDMQNGALSSCNEMGYDLQIHPCNANEPNITEELISLVKRAKLAGLVLAPPISEHQDIIDTLSKNNIHFVRIISGVKAPADGIPCIYVDDRHATYAITEHLIKLGHHAIGFLEGDSRHNSSIERYKGYEFALKKYDLELREELILPGAYTFDSGFNRTSELLSLPNRPTAIIGCNDEIAAGALAAANQSGIEVPAQLSIAGFEDSPFSRISRPAITTAKQATREIARHATLLLIADMRPHVFSDTQNNTNHMGFSPQLVIRESTTNVPLTVMVSNHRAG